MSKKTTKKDRAQTRQADAAPQQPPAWQPPSPTADPQAIFDQALAFHRAGLLNEAEQLYRQVLTTHPKSFDCQHLLGVITYQRGDYADAIAQIDLALKINADVADAHLNRGNALKKLKQLDEALESYDRAAALKPDDPMILNSRGSVLRELLRFSDALADFDAAVALKPDFSEAFNNRANTYKDLELFDAALADYGHAIALNRHNADALSNRGNLYKRLERYDEALADYDQAVAREPRNAEAAYNRGTALLDLDRPDAALAELDRAVALRSTYVEALYNRGIALMNLKRIDDALADYGRVIALEPDHHNAHWNRSLCNLMLGRYREGWVDYERRIETDTVLMPWQNCGRPQWTGSRDVAGKTVFLHAEQGFGDSIMAARYVSRVKELGARIVVGLPAALAPVMEQIGGIEVVTREEAVPPFDLHCPLMSLPRAFDTTVETIPADVPYLRAPTAHLETWRARLPQHGGLRVGINWAGRSDFRWDKVRSIGLTRMLPLLAARNVRFFALQRDLHDGDAELLRGHPHVTPLGHDIESFADTAAIISHLDLVISSDTSVVHLAGALGKPVWVLLHYAPDWRWLLDRTDSPWYPTARLFRQAKIGDWSGVVDAVTAELASLAPRG
jgi:tetratricopeptide (TPR) repeat protein